VKAKKGATPSIITTVKLPPDLLREVDELAEATKTTRSEILRRGAVLLSKLKSAEREGRVLALLPKKEVKRTVTTVMLVET